jgi:uncharacterized damage-inducible protein DinB
MQSTSMKASSTLGAEYIRELESEVRATRECLENVPTEKFDWKPHEKSMQLGYLAQLVADIPRWIQYAIEKGEVNFETYPQFKGTTNAELTDHFDKCVEGAKHALSTVSDEALKGTFELKSGEQLLMSTPIDETISSSINHMVHHRGQLTVYLRLNDIAVPSIYGPSADSGGF